jgi:hypothetical protein
MMNAPQTASRMLENPREKPRFPKKTAVETTRYQARSPASWPTKNPPVGVAERDESAGQDGAHPGRRATHVARLSPSFRPASPGSRRLADHPYSHVPQHEGARRADDLEGQGCAERFRHTEGQPADQRALQRRVSRDHPCADEEAVAPGLHRAGDRVGQEGTRHERSAQGHDK